MRNLADKGTCEGIQRASFWSLSPDHHSLAIITVLASFLCSELFFFEGKQFPLCTNCFTFSSEAFILFSLLKSNILNLFFVAEKAAKLGRQLSLVLTSEFAKQYLTISAKLV